MMRTIERRHRCRSTATLALVGTERHTEGDRVATTLADVERRLWDAADNLRANSGLRSSEYSTPVLGLIFLRYADHRFAQAERAFADRATGRRKIGKLDYQAAGVLYLPPHRVEVLR